MINRMIRATQADISLYEEVEHNRNLTNEAFTIVATVAGISAIGTFLSTLLLATEGTFGNAIGGALWQFIAQIGGYFIWAYLSFYIGTNFFRGTADYGELLRTLGYAQAPNVLGFIPCINVLAALWSLWLSIVAIRQALDVDTTAAVQVSIAGFLVYMALIFAGAFVTGVLGAIF